MARLIISDDIIHFTEGGTPIEGHVSRLILDNEIVFIIRYVKKSVSATVIHKIKRKFCNKAQRFLWVDLSSNSSSPFSELIGAEIERHPHLLNK